MWLPSPRWALASMLVVGVSSCAATESLPATPAQPDVTQIADTGSEVVALPCFAEAEEVPRQNYETVLNAVALPTASSSPVAIQASDEGEGLWQTEFFAKAALVYRPSKRFELSTTEDFEGRLLFSWGESLAPAPTATAHCATSSDGWVIVPGGFYFDEPMCVTLVVRTDTEEFEVQVGLGLACPGQGPPPTIDE